MNIDFGVVRKYFPDRGFGFVTHTFLDGHQSEIFFHIKKVKNTHPDLSEMLDNEESIKTIYFWYETENTNKGEQIRIVLKSDAIHNMAIDNLPSLVVKIEINWRNIDSTAPVWLRDVSVNLVGVDRASELSLERDRLKSERKDIEEKKRKNLETLKKIEEANLLKLNEEQKIQEEIEENEFEQLVAEIKPLGFTHSNQVSIYIMRNKLGYKYKNISGIVQMEKDGNSWNFKGGFSPKIYARLCKELELGTQGTRARAVGFKSFKNL